MLVQNTQNLAGHHIVLELLNENHRNKLYQAAQDERIWTYNSAKAFGERFHLWFDNALKHLAEKKQLPYAVRRLTDNKILGSTRIYDINHDHHRVTIGYTWYIVDVWGTTVNPECKLLLLTHAFEQMNVNRVEFLTDSRNARSRAAIKKLGAVEEGILRQHMVLDDGYIRDSVMHSIITQEWPEIKINLIRRAKG